MWLRGECVRARDSPGDRTEGHIRTPLSVRTFGPNLWDVFHANGRRRLGRPADRPTTKELGRTLSPCNAPVPGNAADRACGNRACPRFRVPRGRSLDVPLLGRLELLDIAVERAHIPASSPEWGRFRWGRCRGALAATAQAPSRLMEVRRVHRAPTPSQRRGRSGPGT
jgi:hypothetical protein